MVFPITPVADLAGPGERGHTGVSGLVDSEVRRASGEESGLMITDAKVAVPEDMAAVLAEDPDALQAFEMLRPAEQREFVDWLAKPGKQTRQQRLAELPGHVRNHPAVR